MARFQSEIDRPVISTSPISPSFVLRVCRDGDQGLGTFDCHIVGIVAVNTPDCHLLFPVKCKGLANGIILAVELIGKRFGDIDCARYCEIGHRISLEDFESHCLEVERIHAENGFVEQPVAIEKVGQTDMAGSRCAYKVVAEGFDSSFSKSAGTTAEWTERLAVDFV